MGADSSKFEVGDILRFGTMPLYHYAVYIGNGEIVHFNTPDKTYRIIGIRIGIIRESLEEYKKRYNYM